MFHILSKTLEIFISPFIWILILLLIAWLIKPVKWKKRLRMATVAVFIVFSNPLLHRLALEGWEGDLQNTEEARGRAETAVITGGMAAFHEPSQRIRFNGSSDRLWQAITLYKKGYVKRLFISGGSPAIIAKEKSESEYIRDYLLVLGIPERDIFIENRSKNTHQNALYTSEIFEQNRWEKNIILVTSAFHMRRAKGCFEKEGFTVFPYSADPQKSVRKPTLKEIFVPNLGTMGGWSMLLKEWIGITVYKINGYM